MNTETLLIRTDASAQIGTGHAMRCLALAQAWQELEGRAVFAVGMDIGAVEDRLLAEGMEVLRLYAKPGSTDDADQTSALARVRGARWVVADGYHFDTNFQRVVKQHDIMLLYLDDAAYAGEFAADIILNQNISACEGLYAKRPAGTRLLLGPRYALLRREFSKWRGGKREIATTARNVLVTLGGSDPDNVTVTIVRALLQLDQPDLAVRVAVGAANPHCDSLRREMAHGPSGCELLVNTNDMSQLMAWADVAVAAGGSTCWELALMGLPMLVMILADNQRGIAEGLAAHGAAVNLGWHHALNETAIAEALGGLLRDQNRRRDLCRRSQELVDGFGASRVAAMLKEEN
jgi:UDP-2,4-diacetamido-2,4,6-trideoxy-beta-L-altropyranose hydrolase